jgi:hypothetical protein
MSEETLENVDSYAEVKKKPEAIAAEAQKIMEIQNDLGLNYMQREMNQDYSKDTFGLNYKL